MIVVVGSPVTRQTLCSLLVVEYFQGKKLVSEAAIEALDECILPRAPGLNVERAYIELCKPLAQGFGDELRAVVAANESRKPSLRRDCNKTIDHVFALETVADFKAEILTRELVDDHQPLQLLARGGSIEDKVPAPNVIGMLRSSALSRVVAVAEATFLSLFHGYFEPFLFPDAIHSLRVDRPAKLTKLATNEAIAVTRELADKL